MFQIDSLVYGKVKGFDWWPGIISEVPDYKRKINKECFKVNFIGEDNHSYLKVDKLKHFIPENIPWKKYKNNKLLKNAAEVACQMSRGEINLEEHRLQLKEVNKQKYLNKKRKRNRSKKSNPKKASEAYQFKQTTENIYSEEEFEYNQTERNLYSRSNSHLHKHRHEVSKVINRSEKEKSQSCLDLVYDEYDYFCQFDDNVSIDSEGNLNDENILRLLVKRTKKVDEPDLIYNEITKIGDKITSLIEKNSEMENNNDEIHIKDTDVAMLKDDQSRSKFEYNDYNDLKMYEDREDSVKSNIDDVTNHIEDNDFKADNLGIQLNEEENDENDENEEVFYNDREDINKMYSNEANDETYKKSKESIPSNRSIRKDEKTPEKKEIPETKNSKIPKKVDLEFDLSVLAKQGYCFYHYTRSTSRACAQQAEEISSNINIDVTGMKYQSQVNVNSVEKRTPQTKKKQASQNRNSSRNDYIHETRHRSQRQARNKNKRKPDYKDKPLVKTPHPNQYTYRKLTANKSKKNSKSNHPKVSQSTTKVNKDKQRSSSRNTLNTVTKPKNEKINSSQRESMKQKINMSNLYYKPQEVNPVEGKKTKKCSIDNRCKEKSTLKVFNIQKVSMEDKIRDLMLRKTENYYFSTNSTIFKGGERKFTNKKRESFYVFTRIRENLKYLHKNIDNLSYLDQRRNVDFIINNRNRLTNLEREHLAILIENLASCISSIVDVRRVKQATYDFLKDILSRSHLSNGRSPEHRINLSRNDPFNFYDNEDPIREANNDENSSSSKVKIEIEMKLIDEIVKDLEKIIAFNTFNDSILMKASIKEETRANHQSANSEHEENLVERPIERDCDYKEKINSKSTQQKSSKSKSIEQDKDSSEKNSNKNFKGLLKNKRLKEIQLAEIEHSKDSELSEIKADEDKDYNDWDELEVPYRITELFQTLIELGINEFSSDKEFYYKIKNMNILITLVNKKLQAIRNSVNNSAFEKSTRHMIASCEMILVSTNNFRVGN